MIDYETKILQRQEAIEYMENCDGDCERCDYAVRHYPNSFDDPYYGCLYDDFREEVDNWLKKRNI